MEHKWKDIVYNSVNKKIYSTKEWHMSYTNRDKKIYIGLGEEGEGNFTTLVVIIWRSGLQNHVSCEIIFVLTLQEVL